MKESATWELTLFPETVTARGNWIDRCQKVGFSQIHHGNGVGSPRLNLLSCPELTLAIKRIIINSAEQLQVDVMCSNEFSSPKKHSY